MKKNVFLITIICLILVSMSISVFAHPGRTDANGGHYDKATGNYHYHNDSSSSSSKGNSTSSSSGSSSSSSALETSTNLHYDSNIFSSGIGFNKPNIGVSFTLSDNWNIVSESDDDLLCQYRNSEFETFEFAAAPAEWAYSLEFANEGALLDLIKDFCSNSILSQELSEANNTYVTVKTDSELTKYETYNKVKYFRYEKAYTASAVGYYNKPLYLTVFATAINGNMYVYIYKRDMEANHFSDIVAVLNNVSYKSGEIKIKINNEYIHPDSAPMMINDRTLVPIRAVAEKMGYTVGWDEDTQIVTLISEDNQTMLNFQVGVDTALKNLYQEIKLDVPAVIIGSRTYLPLRAVAEAMDAKVDWDEANNTVLINY